LASHAEQESTPQFGGWGRHLGAGCTVRPFRNNIEEREPVEIRRHGLVLRDRLRKVGDLVFEITDAFAKRRILAGPQRAPFTGRLAYGITDL
jgi:hypothetical protein